MKFTGFIPCRAGSERVRRKNVRPFAGFENGLIELKFRQLATCPIFDEIIVSTNDPEVAEYTNYFASRHDERFVVSERPDYLGRSDTSMGEFIGYIGKLREAGVLFWTHVTSPFLTAQFCQEAAAAYVDGLSRSYDSLVTVNKLHKFLWDENGPYNYENTVEKWPRSQDIKPLMEINHGVYIIPFQRMREVDDRVGRSPQLYETPEIIAMDIDWEEQFELLDVIARAQPALLGSLRY